MANRGRDSSPTPSQSSQTDDSPPSHNTRRLAPMPVAVPDDKPSPSRSVGSTPGHQTIDLPRLPAASKGGCWTCRLRRKKCDEQREGGSCRTCRRLTIDCLGWGPKRPEWMRDKRAVEAYKAEIKAKLTRAGLIRGQPRTTFRSQNSTPVVPSQTRPAPYHRASAPDISTSSASSSSSHQFQQPDYDSLHHHFMPSLPGQHHRQSQEPNMIPGVPGASNSGFHPMPDYPDSTLHALDLHTPFYQFPPSVTPISSSSDSLNVDFSTFGVPQEHSPFGFDSPNPQISVVPTPDQQPSFDNEYVLYYFEHVRREHMFFAGTTFTNATYSMISQDPQGPVMKAVCALASSHLTKSRIAQGLENPDTSNAMHAAYCLQEAVFLIDKAKQLRGSYTEGEALAALLLIGYSQISGGEYDWRSPFAVMNEWLEGTGLARQEDPVTTYLTLTVTTQLLVKATLSLDLFISIATGRSPRYHGLTRALLGEQGRLWTRSDGEVFNALQIDLLTGCPNEVMVALVDIAMLSQWKAEETRNRTLSYRELVRRADEIERRLRHQDLASFPVEVNQAPLHPTLAMQLPGADQTTMYPSEGVRRLVGQLHNETAMLFLHAIINNQNPGVPEISGSLGNIIQLLERLAPSEIDRAIIFPLCLAGCLSDDMSRRTFFQRRLHHIEGGFRNSMQLKQAIETVWHQRDVMKDAIDFRPVVRGQSLLLV